MYKRKLGLIIVLLSMVVCLCSCMSERGNKLTVRVLKIGKADAILMHTNSGAVLIDTGEEEDGPEILQKASEMGIEKLDYLILTHYDKDHVGGAAEVIRGMEVGEIIEPGYAKESKEYEAYVKAATEAGVKRTDPAENISLELDGVTYTIMMPQKNSYKDDNDHSIVVKTEYSGYSLLFAGDSMDERMEELLEQGNLSADVLKVPHHGSYEKKSEEFLGAVNPEYAIITCSNKKPADEEVLDYLEELGSKVYQTADGDVRISISQNGVEVIQ